MGKRKFQDSFPVRINRRLFENRGQVCPKCGQADPLLLLEDGRCAHCASSHKEEKHHILGRAFRTSKEEKEAVIPISPNAHRLVSDLQADHPEPPIGDPASRLFLESQLWELLLSVSELWLVWKYLGEESKAAEDIPALALILLAMLFLMNLHRLDLSKLLADAKGIYYAKQA